MSNGVDVKSLVSVGWLALAHGRGMLSLQSSVASSVPGMVKRLCRRLVTPNKQLSLPPISLIP